jgi:hypothetical protein
MGLVQVVMRAPTRRRARWLVAATLATLQLSIPVVADAVDQRRVIAGSESGVWDPNDVAGRFDLRWVGAAYTSEGEIHLSVSFYDGFERRRLPRDPTDSRSNVRINLSGALNGYFLRRPGGRIIFLWGDFGSSCCAPRGRVRQPLPNVLSVTIDPCSYGYGTEIVMAQGQSLWVGSNVEAEDVTGVVELDHPVCDT